MRTLRDLRIGGRAITLLVAVCVALVSGGRAAGQVVSIDGDDIGGAVRGASGPEAGVWVVAETDDLATRFLKIVVTDDQGRYVLPDLPPANYDVWVRGYGLKDSPRQTARPGQTLNLLAAAAGDAQEAAIVYPANYWYSMLEIPGEDEFPGTGASGNGISAGLRTRAHWIDRAKQGCQLCHQLGNKATRELFNADDFDSTEAAWAHRLMTGQRGSNMGAELREAWKGPRARDVRRVDRPDLRG